MTDPQDYDIEFFFDPVCPFAWITSRWIASVAEQKDLRVDWRFISLRIINEDRDYERDFPPGYLHGHMTGLRLLRVAAATRDRLGHEAVGAFYTALGTAIWHDNDTDEGNLVAIIDPVARLDEIEAVLESAGLPVELATASTDEGWDQVIREETELALGRTGSDVGTPTITVDPPDGMSFFGPVISRIPEPDHALELWDAVVTLARFPGFAELKRSLREVPRLPVIDQITGSRPGRRAS